MTRIAYVTDLHFGHPRTAARIESFANKMAKLPANTRAVCITGDLFAITDKLFWDTIINGPLTAAEIKDQTSKSRELADNLSPQFFPAIPEGIAVFLVPGNADILSYEHLAALSSTNPDQHYINGRAMQAGSAFNLLGAGSITPDNADAIKILNYNPWYGGVVSPERFDQSLNGLLAQTQAWRSADWSQTIFMTHMPAFGHVDQYNGKSQGSSAVLDFLKATRPLLHLAGHVHEGPFVNDKYAPWSIVDGQTVSLNAGGNPRHDSEAGVRLLSIDISALTEARGQNRLAEAAAGALIRL